MLTPSTTHPESPFAEPSYPVFVYERIPGAWSFLGVMPHYPTDTVSPIREEVDDGTGVCPPGYTLVAMQPCFVYALSFIPPGLPEIKPTDFYI